MEHCSLCTDKLVIHAKYPCDHVVCERCCLRMRWLMSDNTCPFCRSLAEEVHLARNLDGIIHEPSLCLKKYGLFCQDDAMKKGLEHLMRFPCPKCDKELLSLKALKEHVSSVHRSNICMVCARNASQFSDEYALYNGAELNRHMTTRHRRCEFCKWTFYSPEDLANHCRKEHESCFICDKRDPTKPQYFANYAKLEEHFQRAHYACMVQECINDKFVVFADRVELQAHMATEHPALVGKNRLFRELKLEDMTPEPPKPSPAHDEDPQALAQRRFGERLKIYANHDQEKIDKILAANSTFEKRHVPTAAFISTYSNILQAPEEQITVLLTEFSKITLADQKKTQELSNALAHRASAALVKEASSTPRTSSPGPSSNPGPSTRSKAPVLSGWAGANYRPPGAVNMNNLPRLGEKKRAEYMSTPSASVRPAIPAAGNAKSNAKPKKTTAAYLMGGSGPQTRLPALTSRSDRIALNERLRSASASPTPSPGPSSSTTSPYSSQASTPRGSGVDLASLPRLPAANQRDTKKKGTTRVIRLV